RSAGEMRDRLVQREVPAAIIHEVMARMDRAELIDDEAFAHDWVQQRRELRALSDLALRRELGKRSVDAGIIDAALACTERDEEHTSELQSRFELVCRLLLAKKKLEWTHAP